MLGLVRTGSALLALSLAVVGGLATCSSSARQDGASCDDSSDCASGRCSAGTCEGSDCACEGADCRGRSSCQPGWLCTRSGATTADVVPRCRMQCSADAGGCPSDKHCERGVCVAGAEPFALAWANIPRARPCAAKVPCEYVVRAPASVTVDTYAWTFDDAPPVETKEPTTSKTYEAGGSHSVLVRARATSGALAELRTTEVLCQGAVGAGCDPSGAPCCEGSCTAQRVCK